MDGRASAIPGGSGRKGKTPPPKGTGKVIKGLKGNTLCPVCGKLESESKAKECKNREKNERLRSFLEFPALVDLHHTGVRVFENPVVRKEVEQSTLQWLTENAALALLKYVGLHIDGKKDVKVEHLTSQKWKEHINQLSESTSFAELSGHLKGRIKLWERSSDSELGTEAVMHRVVTSTQEELKELNSKDPEQIFHKLVLFQFSKTTAALIKTPVGYASNILTFLSGKLSVELQTQFDEAHAMLEAYYRMEAGHGTEAALSNLLEKLGEIKEGIVASD